MSARRATEPIDVLKRFAPGTALREAVELILRQDTGGLVLFGWSPTVEAVCTGGFTLHDAPFTAQRLAELSKMDGGLVVDNDATRILRANVHFIPDATIPTDETGTRHRTAQRVAVQTGKPVLAISEGLKRAMVYVGPSSVQLRSPTDLLSQANQSLNSLERLRRRLDGAEAMLTRFEVEDTVVMRDAVTFLQRVALIRRLDAAFGRMAVELGGASQMLELQAADLVEGVDRVAHLVYGDYAKRRSKKPVRILEILDGLSADDLYDAVRVASALGLGPLDAPVRPRGLRALGRVPRLPGSVQESLISRFPDFQDLLHAPAALLEEVEGVGRSRAHQLRRYFDRMLEASSAWILDD